MDKRTDSATARLGSTMLRTLAPLLTSLGGGLAGEAVSEAADLIDELVAEVIALRAARDMNAAQRDVALAFADDVRAALGDGTDEHSWPPGMTAPEAVVALRAALRAPTSMVTVEAHARAVREASIGGYAEYDDNAFHGAHYWAGSEARSDLISDLSAAGLSDADAVALADGRASDV